MKPTFLMMQSIALLLALSGGGGSAKTDNWVCYDLVFGAAADFAWDKLPSVDEPAMFGRLAFPLDELPGDGLHGIEGRIRLEPEEEHEHLHRWRGQNSVMLFTWPGGSLNIELRGFTTHNLLSLTQRDGAYDSVDYSGQWADVFGWGPPKTGAFRAELVPAYSLANCMSMK